MQGWCRTAARENLNKEAKRWLKELRANDRDARVRFEHAYPAAPPKAVLRDVQPALARELGHESWITLKLALETTPIEDAAPIGPTRTAGEYERLANDLVLAFNSHDQAALQRVNKLYRRSFTFDDLWAEVWRRVYAFRQRSSRVPKPAECPRTSAPRAALATNLPVCLSSATAKDPSC